MSTQSREKRVTIVGAGMSGCMAGLFLARRGFDVEIYERRGDIRKGFMGPSRSLNMTLSHRGLEVLREVGLLEEILKLTVEVKGRQVRDEEGNKRYHPYGKEDWQVLHAIARNDLNCALLTAVEDYPNIKVKFRQRFVKLDKDKAITYFHDEERDQRYTVSADWVVGADGTFSMVRRNMYHGERADFQQQFLDWDYKELTIPAASDGSYQLDPHALHLWPRGDCMVMALPNLDGSFNCICSMPAQGEPSFSSLSTQESALDFFRENFPELVVLIPTLEEDFVANPTSAFLTVRARPWHYKDRVVLVGDAAHSVVPFYGQGMISAFEDCSVLDRCLERFGDNVQAAFAEFEDLRKPNTDSLADLSVNNFYELRDKIRDPNSVIRRKGEALLGSLFPKAWWPVYSMIAHSTMPYSEAWARYRRQQRIARWFGFDLILKLCVGVVSLGGALKRVRRRFDFGSEWATGGKRRREGAV